MNANLRTWVNVSPDSDFSIHNIPFGIFSSASHTPRAASAIGDYVLDLQAVAALGLFADLGFDSQVLAQPVLNDFIALGKDLTQAVRLRIQALLTEGDTRLQAYTAQVLVPMSQVTMHLPVRIGDYTDFYSSIEHATNVGKLFRPDNPLMPNWRHLPVGYHGRASSIVVSGTDFHRPKGQTKTDDAAMPTFHPSRTMDFELEVAFIVGKNTQIGQTVSTAGAEDYIFGLVLFNDWSARDIQRWEYVPLGPFLGKNFASSVSPWIVTLEALAPFRVAGPAQDPEVLPYLQTTGANNIDIALSVSIAPEGQPETVISRSNYKYLYWNMRQQLAHHTVNGCNIQVGDMCASGTISGPTPDSFGSLLELTYGGKQELTLANGVVRKFLQDNDTVIMRGYAQKDGIRVGFGEVKGKLLPTLP